MFDSLSAVVSKSRMFFSEIFSDGVEVSDESDFLQVTKHRHPKFLNISGFSHRFRTQKEAQHVLEELAYQISNPHYDFEYLQNRLSHLFEQVKEQQLSIAFFYSRFDAWMQSLVNTGDERDFLRVIRSDIENLRQQCIRHPEWLIGHFYQDALMGAALAFDRKASEKTIKKQLSWYQHYLPAEEYAAVFHRFETYFSRLPTREEKKRLWNALVQHTGFKISQTEENQEAAPVETSVQDVMSQPSADAALATQHLQAWITQGAAWIRAFNTHPLKAGGLFLLRLLASQSVQAIQVRVNQFTDGVQTTPYIMSVGGERVFFTWQCQTTITNYDICGRVSDGLSYFLGPEFIVNQSPIVASRVRPRLTVGPDHSVMAYWLSNQQGAYNIYARQLDPSGQPLTPEQRINITDFRGDQQHISCASDAPGERQSIFFTSSGEIDPADGDLALRFFAANLRNGSLQTPTFSARTNYGLQPDIIFAGPGAVVAWIETSPSVGVLYSSVRNATSGATIWGGTQRTDANVRANNPKIALLDGDNLGFVWERWSGGTKRTELRRAFFNYDTQRLVLVSGTTLITPPGLPSAIHQETPQPLFLGNNILGIAERRLDTLTQMGEIWYTFFNTSSNVIVSTLPVSDNSSVWDYANPTQILVDGERIFVAYSGKNAIETDVFRQIICLQPCFENARLTLEEGQTVNITRDNIAAQHLTYLDPAFTFNATVLYGWFECNGTQVTSFSQSDVLTGRLTFTSIKEAQTAPEVNLTLAWGMGNQTESVSQQMRINYTPINDPPEFLTPPNLQVEQEGTVLMTFGNFNVTDPDSEEWWIIISNLFGGYFFGSDEQITLRFNRSDLGEGNIAFRASGAVAPRFNARAEDPEGASSPTFPGQITFVASTIVTTGRFEPATSSFPVSGESVTAVMTSTESGSNQESSRPGTASQEDFSRWILLGALTGGGVLAVLALSVGSYFGIKKYRRFSSEAQSREDINSFANALRKALGITDFSDFNSDRGRIFAEACDVLKEQLPEWACQAVKEQQVGWVEKVVTPLARWLLDTRDEHGKPVVHRVSGRGFFSGTTIASDYLKGLNTQELTSALDSTVGTSLPRTTNSIELSSP